MVSVLTSEEISAMHTKENLYILHLKCGFNDPRNNWTVWIVVFLALPGNRGRPTGVICRIWLEVKDGYNNTVW